MFAPAHLPMMRLRIPSPLPSSRIEGRALLEEAGGFPAAEAAIAPFLRNGVIGFALPRPAFEQIALPSEVAAARSLDEAEALLRPYLLEERAVLDANGAPARLFAAVLIPQDFGDQKNGSAAQYWSRNITDTALESVVTRALDSALRRAAIETLGLPRDTLDNGAGYRCVDRFLSRG